MSPDVHHGHGQGNASMTENELVVVPRSRQNASTSESDVHSHLSVHAQTPPAGGPMSPAEEAYFAHAYTAVEMQTFHCERVRKMPLSGLDPSMLIGFGG
jgi:cysteine protease ATG4